MANRIIFLLLLAFLSACGADADISKKQPNDIQKTPVLIQKATNIQPQFAKANRLDAVQFKYCGKYMLADTIDLEKDITKDGDYIIAGPIDSFNSDGFRFFLDYNTNLSYQLSLYKDSPFVHHFPIYVFNPTRQTKVFKVKDERVFGIQEALDTANNTWHPINYKEAEFCGVGYIGIKVRPYECIVFAAPKYQGEQEGQMRLRFDTGLKTYISPIYIGSYSAQQFLFSQENNRPYIPPTDTNYYFFGAIPK